MTFMRNNISYLLLTICLLILFVMMRPSPLLGNLGFEAANILVLIFAPLLAINASLSCGDNYIKLIKSYAWLGLYISLYVLLLAINGLFSKSCSLGYGWLAFIMVALPPLSLNLALGLFIASLNVRFSIKFFLILLFYLGYALWLGMSWWYEPYFRLLTHFSIIMTSDLLTGDVLHNSVIGFRLATMLWSIVILLIIYIKDSNAHKFKPILISFVLGLMAIGLQHYSIKALGKNKVDLERDYQLLASHNGLNVLAHPAKVTMSEAHDILQEALLYQHRLRKKLGEVSLKPINIWLHASKEDKYLYTGAKNVHFALPKHRELHIDSIKIPHPVLGHELAHIYIGEYSDNIFGAVGGKFLPNLALTEGLAMLLSLELNVEDDLVMLEQAQALHQIDISPDMDKLFSSNIYFALFDPHASYIFTGAFLGFFLDSLPQDEAKLQLKKLIKSGSLAHTLKKDFSHHITEFKAALAKPVYPHAHYWAKTNFMKNSILLNDCMHNDYYTINWRQAIINNDIDLLVNSIKSYPLAQQKIVIDQALALAKSPSTSLALFSLKEELSPIMDEHSRLMKSKILIRLNDFPKAFAVINTIDEALFNEAEQRLIAALKILLKHYIDHQDHLSKQALAYLADNNQASSLAFSYALGQDQEHNIVSHLSSYLYMRILLYHHDAISAKEIATKLLAIDPQWPKIFTKELLSMLVTINYELKLYNEALAYLEELAKLSYTKASLLMIEDKRDRILWSNHL